MCSASLATSRCSWLLCPVAARHSICPCLMALIHAPLLSGGPVMLPSTVERVPQHTAAHINEQIRRRTEQNVARFAADPTAIEDRLAELDQEWDIERTLEANAATVSLIGLALGAAVDRRFFVLPGLV